MSDAYRVRLRTVGHGPTALGEAGPFTLVTDRPATGGGGGLGFNGGQLLYLSIAACWSNDLFREAATMGIELDGVEITVDGDFPARGRRAVKGLRGARARADRGGRTGGRDPASHP